MTNTATTVSLLGAPVERGAGRLGCAMGPAAFRTVGIVDTLEALGATVEDLGDADCQPVADASTEFEVVHDLDVIAGWTRSLMARAEALALDPSRFPIYLGGDHSLSLGTVAGHAAAAHKLGRKQFVLWLDAHADFNTFATTESGNLHGTPLAFICGQPHFEPLLGHTLDTPVPPDQVCILGLRSVDRDERELVVDEGVTVHDMRTIDEHGVTVLVGEFIEKVRQFDGLLHVSLDVDFLDPDIAPAVGTTVPGGATFREAHLIMEMLHDSGLVTSLDLVELNPMLDERGKTAALMVDLTASLFGRQVLDRHTRAW